MIPIKYTRGDATQPKGKGVKYIIHCCNDVGGWGAGFVIALSKRWEEPEKQYRDWAHNREGTGKPFELGQVQIVIVETSIIVANMIGQRDTRWCDGVPPIRYEAIDECLSRVYNNIERNKKLNPKHPYSIHCPRFGAGLAGGNWKEIESLIEKNILAKNIPVTVYDL